ncbi:MAG: hypothetical protein CR986_07335 [Ignavibacteriae bacterium]|nr:MAG: hypothetical protein CR986_07335 [Ignavibacteriota bacterium]
MSEEKIPVTIGEYKDKPIISLPVAGSTKYPFTFGLNKAKAIMEYIEDIKKFIEENDKNSQTTAE